MGWTSSLGQVALPRRALKQLSSHFSLSGEGGEGHLHDPVASRHMIQ
jgi:hypothetical protein